MILESQEIAKNSVESSCVPVTPLAPNDHPEIDMGTIN